LRPSRLNWQTCWNDSINGFFPLLFFILVFSWKISLRQLAVAHK
jgi:hypothetical protein